MKTHYVACYKASLELIDICFMTPFDAVSEVDDQLMLIALKIISLLYSNKAWPNIYTLNSNKSPAW